MKEKESKEFQDRYNKANVESKRNVITEREILSVSCPTCRRVAGKLCITENGIALSKFLDQNEASFHGTRIVKAQDEQIKRLGFGDVVSATDKALILYYAFTMLCDSVSVNSPLLCGKQMTSEDVQRFFAAKAIEELKHDGLLINVRKTG